MNDLNPEGAVPLRKRPIPDRLDYHAKQLALQLDPAAGLPRATFAAIGGAVLGIGMAVAELRDQAAEVDRLRGVEAEHDRLRARLGETREQWAIRTDSTDHAPDCPKEHLGEKVILDYPMDEHHARRHSEPWGWRPIYRTVGQWRDVEGDEAQREVDGG